MIKVPTKCPICGKDTYASCVVCSNCGSTITNKFGFSKFEKLDDRQTEFVLAFIECEGSIKEMERRFDISYPTVKSRLADIRKTLGLADGKSYKQTVLEELSNGDIDFDSALKLIKEKDAQQ